MSAEIFRINNSSKFEVIVEAKSDKTLKNNMDTKDEEIRKRTSLVIVPHQLEKEDTDLNKEQKPQVAKDNIDNNTQTAKEKLIDVSQCSDQTTCKADHVTSKKSIIKSDIDDRFSIASDDNSASRCSRHFSSIESRSTNSSLSFVEEVLIKEHHTPKKPTFQTDNSDNKNITESPQKSYHTCASDLRENNIIAMCWKRENVRGRNTLNNDKPQIADEQPKSLPPFCDTLLSPHEVPMGRRYAEVAQFKRCSDPGTQTQSDLKPLTASSICARNNTNSNNDSNINRHMPINGINTITENDSNNVGGQTNLSFDLDGPNDASEMTAANQHLITDTGALSESFHSLRSSDSICCESSGLFDDDMQALLPKCSQHVSRDEFSESHTSIVSSLDGGILAEGESSSESSPGGEDCPPCDLGLVERLLLTHPVWFLQGIQRSGAVHFLQGKEEGNFIVRGSSQPNTMAVSVRLPPDTGPYIEHYLIQSNEGILSLESSRFKFDSIPALIAHYAQCCDELPVQLILPLALREAKNRQQLSSLALLGQEFWRYPMSSAKPASAETDSHPLLMDPKSPNSLTDSSGLGATLFSDSGATNSFQHAAKLFCLGNQVGAGSIFSQAGTPSDTTSSMSSFTTSGGQHMQLLSPASVDSVILTMSPVDLCGQRSGVSFGLGSDSGNDLSIDQPNNLSTFKSCAGVANQLFNKNNFESSNAVRPQRPKPPNTLNLDLRKPPAPPMRWSKPLSPSQPLPLDKNNSGSGGSNFTVTTTVTFSVDKNSPKFVEVTTPTEHALRKTTTFQTFAKRLSPEGECKDSLSSLESASSRWHPQISKDSNNCQKKILSADSAGSGMVISGANVGVEKVRKHKPRKESNHYRDTDILESPQIYCRSALGDKISDYEDLWSHDSNERNGFLISFKPPPESSQNRCPDLLAETPTIIPLHSNVLSPATGSGPTAVSAAINQNISRPPSPTDDTVADTHQLIQFSGEAQPRSRTGLLLPGIVSQSPTENRLQVDSGDIKDANFTPKFQTSTPTQTIRSKQGSPFYAEPADALGQAGVADGTVNISLLRRVQRSTQPVLHRHSEPPKSDSLGGRTAMCQRLQAADNEKISGSLDELKKKPQESKQGQTQQQPTKRARGPFEQWQIDSSWEFMGQSDNETEFHYADDFANEQQQPKTTSGEKEASPDDKQKPITVHQIIAKRLPDLNLPELVRCSTPQQQPQVPPQLQSQPAAQCATIQLNGSQKSIDTHTSCRLSSYDNVQRNNYSCCQFYGIDSAQSDDGTVFSEPWDSSHWDSLLPTDDTTNNSETIHLSKCRPIVSEDDTIIEEFIAKESNQDTLRLKKGNRRQKVATILRNQSMRDREILCHPRNKINPYGAGPGDALRTYTMLLSQDASSTFARNIVNFIACTKESREAAPQVVMRNMRQFMNGMKNYLVKHGEGKFHQEVESARARLKSDEFLNLDAILETVMHQLIVLPLREHLYGMFVDYYTRSEDIQLLAQNVKYACARSATEFGIRVMVTPPSTTSLQVISNLLLRLQEAELPLDKLEIFLCVISTIFETTGCPRGQQLVADDFLPILVYVVAKCGFVGAEIEAEFMWGLLQQPLLNGEPGYYLTSLCSAVQVLKRFMASEQESGSTSLDWRSSSLPASSSVLRVIIPDECNGSLQTRTLPVRPHTTTREVCRSIAHKARITNPQDYALFQLVDGEETLINDTECPQDLRFAVKGKHCMLAYKRIDAKIAWPTAVPQPGFSN